VPARSALIIAVREANQGPVVLSTSRHITQGAVDLLDEKWNVASKTLSGMSKVVGNDPYEIRVATGEKGWKASDVEIPEADRKAGVTVSIAQEKGLIRMKIVSPETRTLRWSLKLQE
jgi:hypothetical protein